MSKRKRTHDGIGRSVQNWRAEDSAPVAGPCANGCRYWRTDDDGSSTREPRRAKVGRVCGRCHERMEQWLDTLPDTYALLPEVIEPGTVDIEELGITRGKLTNPPIPVRPEVVDLTDSRLVSWPDGSLGRRGVLGFLDAWGSYVRSVRLRSERTETLTVTGESKLLRDHLDWLCEQEWAGEFCGQLRKLMRAMETAVGEPWPRPIGRCPECGEPLWMPPEGIDTIRCAQCRAQWTRDRWLLLADVLEGEADSQQ